MASLADLKIQLSVVGVQQATESINRIQSGLKGLSARQKSLNTQAAFIRAQINLQKAQAGANPPSFLSRAAGVLKSSRFGAGGLMPLVGQAAKLLGPWGTALAAGAVAVTAMTDAAVEAGQALQELAYGTGSQGSTLGGLRGISGVLGGPGAVGSLSSQLQSKITTDAMARAVGLTMGIQSLPRPFGNVDEGQNLLQAIKELRKITDFEERLRAARVLGLEGAGPVLNQSEGQFQKSQERGEFSAKIFGDPKVQQNVADFMQALSDLGASFMNVLGVLGKNLLPRLTKFVNWFADVMNGLADWLDKNQWLIDLIFGNQVAPGGIDNSVHVDALNANIRATQENTMELNRLNGLLPGVYGRGDRTTSAFPRSLAPGVPGNSPQFLNANDARSFRMAPF